MFNVDSDDMEDDIAISSIAYDATAWWPLEIVEDTTAYAHPSDRLRCGNFGRLCWSNSDQNSTEPTWGEFWWDA